MRSLGGPPRARTRAIDLLTDFCVCQQLYLIHWPVAFKPGNELFPKTSDGSELTLNRDVSISQTWKGAFRFPLSCSSPLPLKLTLYPLSQP